MDVAIPLFKLCPLPFLTPYFGDTLFADTPDMLRKSNDIEVVATVITVSVTSASPKMSVYKVLVTNYV